MFEVHAVLTSTPRGFHACVFFFPSPNNLTPKSPQNLDCQMFTAPEIGDTRKKEGKKTRKIRLHLDDIMQPGYLMATLTIILQ